MTHFKFILVSSAFFLLTSTQVFAQPQVPGGGASRPVFSPYLGLLAGGNNNNAAMMYYGVVRPQMQMQQQLGQMNQQLTQSNNQLQNLQDQQLVMPHTGNVPVFNNYAGYFNRISSGSGSSFNRVGGISGGGMMGGGMMSPGMGGGVRTMSNTNMGGLGTMGGGGMSNQPSFSRPSSTGGVRR